MDNGMSTKQKKDGVEPLSQDLVFDLLSSPRRRFVLYYLRSESASIALTALADEVASWEYETSVDELTEQERKRAYVSLYQTHVPKLVDAGIVAYDTDSGVVSLTDRAGTIESYLPRTAKPEIPWEFIYPSLTVGCVVLFVAILADIGPLSSLEVTIVGSLILLAFGVISITHFVLERRTKRQLPIDVTDHE